MRRGNSIFHALALVTMLPIAAIDGCAPLDGDNAPGAGDADAGDEVHSDKGLPAGSYCALADEYRDLTLSCSNGGKISGIRFASYGLLQGSCSQGLQTTACNAASSTKAVQSACVGKTTCTVPASNSVFGDPCIGKRKALGVIYDCAGGSVGPSPLCQTAGENHTLSLSCSGGGTISAIKFASYGLPLGSCAAGLQTNAECHATTSQRAVESACLGKASCDVAASNGVFGDPCYRKYKTLAVSYACSGGGDGTPGDSTSDQRALMSALTALLDHVKGTHTLNASGLEQQKLTVDKYKALVGSSEAIIRASFALVAAYDAKMGPLWVAHDAFTRGSVTNDIHWTVYNVMQDIMDSVYTTANLTKYESLLGAFKFGSADNFPGKVASPDGSVHTVQISASYPKTFGHLVMHAERPARKPTGTYLAPGTVATITVPLSLVGKGYQVRVGAHSWDFSNKPSVKRLDRSSLVYDINATEVKVASPLGGGIYIEVPYLANAGVVRVQIKNAVRSPFFSATSFHKTSLSEWQSVERNFKAPWADFQSDKFMMQVPTSWIYKLDDPVKLMSDWDTAMDVINDLMGFPRVGGKETMYPQVDLMMRASVFAPGYPSVNAAYNPSQDYGGNAGHHLVRGPQYASDYEFHEQGHAFLFQKFPGESESAVNLLHVAVWHQKFGYDLDTAFRRSRESNNTYQTLDTTAMAWMACFNFSPLKQPMASGEKAYQLKGHAKFVDIARLFGWQGLNKFWYSFNDDFEKGAKSPTDVDGLLLRLSQSVGADLRPLMHFWGVPPENGSMLQASIAKANLRQSAKIYDTLIHYKSLVPANNLAFRDFAMKWWGRQPSIKGYWEEREHARQWDATQLVDTPVRPNGEIYNESSAADIRNTVQGIINLYFPNGRPST